MLIPNPSKKTVRISVKYSSGKFLRLDGSPLPELKEGAIGELVLSVFSLTDEAERQEFIEEQVVEMLPSGTSVYLGMSPNTVRGETLSKLIAPEVLGVRSHYYFVEVQLKEPLRLRLRGEKPPTLEWCKCKLQILDLEAHSLNHALTRASQEFETARISHSGNVFTRAFAKTNGGWKALNELRGFLGE